MGVAKAREKHEMNAHCALLGCRSFTNTVSEISAKVCALSVDCQNRQAGRDGREGGEGDKDQLRSPDGKWIAHCERRVE